MTFIEVLSDGIKYAIFAIGLSFLLGGIYFVLSSLLIPLDYGGCIL